MGDDSVLWPILGAAVLVLIGLGVAGPILFVIWFVRTLNRIANHPREEDVS